MLLEFRVKNYRSIKDTQYFSMAAAKDSTLESSHVLKMEPKSCPDLLKSIVLYGPNAGGKSNIINALNFMRNVVATSATQIREGQHFNCQPFKLDQTSKNEPTEFEITFIDEGIRYQYGFALIPERITEEWLLVYKTQKPQMWFNRKFNPKTQKDEYEFGSHLTGQRSLWQESTRSNALFLSKAVDLNSDRLRPIFLWIVEKLVIFQAGTQPIYNFSIEHGQTKEGKEDLLKFLNAADLSIEDLSFKNKKLNKIEVVVQSGKEPIQIIKEVETAMPQFLHKAENGDATFEIHDESMGTQRLFAFAGPILDILKQGKILIVDEIDSSLHTLMIKFIIQQFHSEKNNGAQLICTVHNTSLLEEKDLFRRDQIWFIKKGSDHSTILYPLTDFSPRKNEALGHGYLLGRYGAIPFIQDYKIK